MKNLDTGMLGKVMRYKPEEAIDCPYFPHKYWITPDAQIWHKYYTPWQHSPNPAYRLKSGYKEYSLCDWGGAKVSARAHRAVALAFIPNPENKPEVDFLDGNKLNTDLNNLKWVDRFENKHHEYHNLKTMKVSHLWTGEVKARANALAAKHCKDRAVKIDQYSVDGKLVKTWDSCADIAKEFNCAQQNIKPMCKREYPIVRKGYYWRYHGEGLDLSKCRGKVKLGSPSIADKLKTIDIYEAFKHFNFEVRDTSEYIGTTPALVRYHVAKLFNYTIGGLCLFKPYLLI